MIEIETYRTLALLGLPEAQRLAPSINTVEQRLAEVTDEMRKTGNLADNRHLLDELTALAAEVEAGAAASVFRFGASRGRGTYYVVSLFGYIAKALSESGLIAIEPGCLTAAFIPVGALAIWTIVRRTRHKHIGRED